MTDFPNVDNPRYLIHEFPNMESELTDVCRQLKTDFKNGTYSLIIGEDTSGRLPTLVIKGVSDGISDRNGIEKVKIVFMAVHSPSSSLDDQLRDRVLRYIDKEKKALVVTEHVDVGKQISSISDALSSKGISFDVAILGTWESSVAYLYDTLPQDTRIFVGKTDGAPQIDLRRGTGLRGKTAELIREAPEANEYPSLKRIHKETREIVTNARRDVKTMVGKILNII